ncbi:hypothetical protein KKA00_12785 [bacterium]|nr:hypothetical protein [bacterium]MBU1653092.1 hypothetical protein [bacterium]
MGANEDRNMQPVSGMVNLIPSLIVSGRVLIKEKEMLVDHNYCGFLVRLLTLSVLIITLAANPAFSHCDSEDGPIIPLIRTSLDNGNITPLLKWLASGDEAEIKDLFTRVLTLRTQSDEAREIADRLFIETFIRVHRASEGASYTGIKEAGIMPPIFAELDKALESGSVDALADKVANAVRENIVKHFDRAVELGKHQDHSVEAGREFVEAYVTYMHFVEGLHNYLSPGAQGHHSAADENHGH